MDNQIYKLTIANTCTTYKYVPSPTCRNINIPVIVSQRKIKRQAWHCLLHRSAAPHRTRSREVIAGVGSALSTYFGCYACDCGWRGWYLQMNDGSRFGTIWNRNLDLDGYHTKERLNQPSCERGLHHIQCDHLVESRPARLQQ